MQRNSTAAQLRKTREKCINSIEPWLGGGEVPKVHTKEEEWVIQSYQRPHSQDRETESHSYELLMK